VGLARGPLSAVGPGDVVEAVGFPAMGLFSVELVDAEIRVTGSGPVPQPRPALAERRSEHDRPDGDLVAVEGQVIEAGEQRVVVRHGELDYGLEWPPGTRLAVPPGSVVRATGICRVAAVEEGSYRVFPRAYTLLLASPADFEVVSSPPWWTPQRTLASLVAGLVALATVAGLGGTWIAVLRRQVGRQLAVIEGQLRAEAVAEERRRIAREFHDSVNQGLAAATLRLDAAAHRLTDERSKSVLDCQRMLLATLQAEAREFIWDLRDPAHADSSLAAALATQLQFFEVPAPALIEFDAPAIGPDPGDGLAAEVRHQIVRIVREAVGNAVQHAGSSRIVVRLRHAPPDGLTIEVADDGTGFDLAARAEADGHFGIRGMRERARRIGGELGIETGPAGTRVILAVGLGGPFAAYAASVNRPPQLRRSS
jgi:signal transduction histidine kinase